MMTISKTSVPPGRSQTSSASIPPGNALDVANLPSAASLRRTQVPGPSLATGMSGDPAKAGGDHEEVASDFEPSLDEKPTATISTSLTAASAIDELRHSGTAPGGCAPELVIVGRANSNPDRGYMGRRLNPALGTSVASCGEAFDNECKQPSMASRLTPPSPQDPFSVRRPAKQTAAVVGVQPPSDTAAVDHFSSAFIGA